MIVGKWRVVDRISCCDDLVSQLLDFGSRLSPLSLELKLSHSKAELLRKNNVGRCYIEYAGAVPYGYRIARR